MESRPSDMRGKEEGTTKLHANKKGTHENEVT